MISISSAENDALERNHARTSSRNAYPASMAHRRPTDTTAEQAESHMRKRSSGVGAQQSSSRSSSSSRSVGDERGSRVLLATQPKAAKASETAAARSLRIETNRTAPDRPTHEREHGPAGAQSSSSSPRAPAPDAQAMQPSPLSTTGASSTFDRPYSPLQASFAQLPSPVGRSASADSTTATPLSAVRQQPARSWSLDSAGAPAAREPRMCTFVVVDDTGGAPPLRGFHARGEAKPHSHSPAPVATPSAPAQGAKARGSEEKHSRLSWARYFWTLVPAPLRPELGFDQSKCFRVLWVDAPPETMPKGDSGSDPATAGTSQPTRHLEILRFEDTSGWWFFQPNTSGRIVLSEEAVRAVGVDRTFWFAVALAFLGHLDERDGYYAATD